MSCSLHVVNVIVAFTRWQERCGKMHATHTHIHTTGLILTLKCAFKTYHTISLWNSVSWHIVSQNSELIKFHLLAQTHHHHHHRPSGWTHTNIEEGKRGFDFHHRLTVYFSRSIPFRRQRRTSHVSEKRCLNRKCHQCSSFVGAATTVTWTPVPKLRQRVRFLLLVHRVASTTKDVCTRTQCRCQTTKWNNEQNTRAEEKKNANEHISGARGEDGATMATKTVYMALAKVFSGETIPNGN